MVQKYQIDQYMALNYPVIISKVIDSDEMYYQADFPDLPGLKIYADNLSQLKAELADAKREWFASRLAHDQIIPLPSINYKE